MIRFKTLRFWGCTAAASAAGLFVFEAVGQQARPNDRQRIGYAQAAERLGRAMPTGAGVVFGHVEGDAGAYRPELAGPAYDGVVFSLRSGSSEPSSHATRTAQAIYGGTGLAPGVEVVHCMTTGDFLAGGYLRADTLGPPLAEDPTPFPPRVFTHSWIGDPPEKQAQNILRRVDYQIDRRGVVMCVGVNNGRQTPVPALLASAHNVVAVGSAGGRSSGGYTRVAGAGRCKPDLVAPGGQTSFTTPVVAGCAALLMQRGDRLVEAGHAGANRPEVVKAALLGGATKNKRWKPALDKPLDEFQGAGLLNIDRSLRILAGAPAAPGDRLKRLLGWARPVVGPGGEAVYHLSLPVESGPASFTLVWNRRVDGLLLRAKAKNAPPDAEPVEFWAPRPSLADLDLRLVSLHDDQETVLAQSTSRVDNVELIHLPKLLAGDYRIEVVRDPQHETLQTDWAAALAWAIDKPLPGPEAPPPNAPPAP